ncbi:hypothetical protein ACRDNQ_10670 [Palleronia sp. KMU-117]|uniref:hypothetical protein n=1 Tax=Palleronia sp. KMU-117 TaxID=3434108 RepID=UPI003D747BA1
MHLGKAMIGACLVLAACAPSVPDSAAGVGFDDYTSYQTSREAELAGRPAPVPEGPQIAQETMAALGTTAPLSATAPGGVAVAAAPAATPMSAPAAAPAATSNAGISDEQNFDAVSARESIESDAARIAQNRQAYVVIQPTSLPTRPEDGRPNIVAFALATNNPVGTQLYSRSGLNAQSRYDRACMRFASPDLAQEEFLASGGPERDRLGVDPDGDGYACWWDPTPFRAARAAGG